MRVLDDKFYNRDTITVARKLLGAKIVRELNGSILSGMITETEAYLGVNDSACHASRGRTPRNSVMFGPAKLCQAMRIDRKLNGWDVTKGKLLWLESHRKVSAESIRSGPRIGIGYAALMDRAALQRFWF